MPTEQMNQTGGKSGGNGFLKFLLGLFTGAAIATPVTAMIVKKRADEKQEEAVSKAAEDGENRGLAAAVEAANEILARDGLSDEVKQDIEAVFASKEAPEEESGAEKEDFSDDIENWDIKIDDEEANEEARERTEEHERYLNMVDRYKNGEPLQPRVISDEDFSNEHFMEKSYVNWYEDDNVFEENGMVIEDPYSDFGVTQGSELFVESEAENRLDPDIVHVRNEKLSTDFEITRIHGSYAQLVGKEAYYDGEANP